MLISMNSLRTLVISSILAYCSRISFLFSLSSPRIAFSPPFWHQWCKTTLSIISLEDVLLPEATVVRMESLPEPIAPGVQLHVHRVYLGEEGPLSSIQWRRLPGRQTSEQICNGRLLERHKRWHAYLFSAFTQLIDVVRDITSFNERQRLYCIYYRLFLKLWIVPLTKLHLAIVLEWSVSFKQTPICKNF